MALYLYRTRTILQASRFIPTLLSRTQVSQTTSSVSAIAGQDRTTSEIRKTSESSVLPSSVTASDRTNPTKTSSDVLKVDQKNLDASTSTSRSNRPAFMSTPLVQSGVLLVLAGVIYYGYTMMMDDRELLKNTDDYSKATIDYQASNTMQTDVKT